MRHWQKLSAGSGRDGTHCPVQARFWVAAVNSIDGSLMA